MSDLKPCPFCGGTDISIVYPADGGARGRCEDCGACGEHEICSDDAAAAWNKRTDERAEQAEALLAGVLADSRAGLLYKQEKHKTWGNYHCLYCEAFGTSSNLDHKDGCPIKAARELLAKIELGG